MKKISLTLTLVLESLLLSHALSVKAESSLHHGAEKAQHICAACHDASGISKSPDFPILAGQHEDYIREALQAYKRGDRKNPIMKAQASLLSDQDIEDVAAYYSQQPAGVRTTY